MNKNPEATQTPLEFRDSVYNGVSFTLVGPLNPSQTEKMIPVKMRIGDTTLSGYIPRNDFKSLYIRQADVSLVQKTSQPPKYSVKVVPKDGEASQVSFDFLPNSD